MGNRNKKLALYYAAFLSNVAVVGVGLGLFEGKEDTIYLGIITLGLGAFITWKVEK